MADSFFGGLAEGLAEARAEQRQKALDLANQRYQQEQLGLEKNAQVLEAQRLAQDSLYKNAALLYKEYADRVKGNNQRMMTSLQAWLKLLPTDISPNDAANMLRNFIGALPQMIQGFSDEPQLPEGGGLLPPGWPAPGAAPGAAAPGAAPGAAAPGAVPGAAAPGAVPGAAAPGAVPGAAAPGAVPGAAAPGAAARPVPPPIDLGAVGQKPLPAYVAAVGLKNAQAASAQAQADQIVSLLPSKKEWWAQRAINEALRGTLLQVQDKVEAAHLEAIRTGIEYTKTQTKKILQDMRQSAALFPDKLKESKLQLQKTEADINLAQARASHEVLASEQLQNIITYQNLYKNARGMPTKDVQKALIDGTAHAMSAVTFWNRQVKDLQGQVTQNRNYINELNGLITQASNAGGNVTVDNYRDASGRNVGTRTVNEQQLRDQRTAAMASDSTLNAQLNAAVQQKIVNEESLTYYMGQQNTHGILKHANGTPFSKAEMEAIARQVAAGHKNVLNSLSQSAQQQRQEQQRQQQQRSQDWNRSHPGSPNVMGQSGNAPRVSRPGQGGTGGGVAPVTVPRAPGGGPATSGHIHVRPATQGAARGTHQAGGRPALKTSGTVRFGGHTVKWHLKEPTKQKRQGR